MPTSADPTAPEAASPTYDEGVLREVAQRMLWLSTAIVDGANAGRTNHSGVKVGGHQARFISLHGDAEIDEGVIWEAVADPAVSHVGNCCGSWT